MLSVSNLSVVRILFASVLNETGECLVIKHCMRAVFVLILRQGVRVDDVTVLRIVLNSTTFTDHIASVSVNF